VRHHKEPIVHIGPLVPAAPSSAPAGEGVVVARDAAREAGSPAAAVPITRESVEAAVTRANEVLAAREPALQFRVDTDTHAVVVQLVDTENHEVLRQVPSEEMLAIAKAIDHMEIALLRQQA
jgi:flagellar protein FlaG